MILIAGDSWACGEWSDHGGVSHGGLAQFLRESGRDVINIGRGGGSNSDSSHQLANFLTNNPQIQTQIECAVVFQTEWGRDSYLLDSDQLKEMFEHGYEDGRARIISRFYYKLSSTSKDFNLPIYVIGGNADTLWLDRFEEEYPGVSIACQSFTNLVVNNNPRTTTPVYCPFIACNQIYIAERLKPIIHSSDLGKLLDDIDLGKARSSVWKKTKQYFWPDDYHANRAAHRVLFDYLINNNIIP